MKLIFLLTSFLTLFSAANDCCLSELEKELIEISQNHEICSEHENEKESESCESCHCSRFCSFTMLTRLENIEVPEPKFKLIWSYPRIIIASEKFYPFQIFHPPIV